MNKFLLINKKLIQFKTFLLDHYFCQCMIVNKHKTSKQANTLQNS